MPRRVAEVREGKDDTNGHGVYSFIRDLIVEGKDARFVNKKGRYVINWTRALKCYNDYKSKKNPQFKSKNIDRRKASNGLRSALLNFYKKEGAKEYKDGKKVNDKEEVIERQFQMPPRVLESLFGSEVQLSDDGSENETNSIVSEADEKPQVTPTSSDTGFDEAMDISDDWFNSNAEPSSLYAVGDLPVDDSILDNIKTEEDQVDPSDITTPCQMFDISEEEFDSALGEICSNSDNDVDLLGVVQDICPSSGSVKGGLQFLVTFTEELPEDDKSGIAHFDGIGDVYLDKLNPFTFAGIIPASQQPGPVPVTVSTQAGRWLGMTYFLYVDEIQEVLKQLVKDPALQSLYFAMWSQEYGIFGSDDNAAQNLSPFTFQDQGSSIQAKHSQGLKVLQLLVYTAAQTNAEQFIQMIFSTSVGKIVFNTYKGRTPLPEDVARANGHDDLAQYLQDINRRLSKEIDTDEQTSTIDWLELSNAVNKVQKQSAAKDDDDDNNGQSKDDDNQSDYFADVETSSCGSFELDVEWSAFEDGEADVKATSYIHTSSCASFEIDVGWSDSEDGEGPCSKDREPKKELRKKTKSSLVKGSLSKKPAMLMVVPGVETQADQAVDKKDYDDENYKDTSIVKDTSSEKTAMLVPGVGTQADHAVNKKDYDDENYKETSFVKSSLSEKPAMLVPEVGTHADHAVDKQDYDDENFKETSIIKGSSSEKLAMLVPGAGSQADHAGDKKDYDDENYKDTSTVNYKPGRKLFNGYGLPEWLYKLHKWRQSEATAPTQQEACVDETQEKQSFAQKIIQKCLFRGGGTQLSEDVTSARGEAKAFPSQEKTAKPKRHKQRRHWRNEPLFRERYVLLTIALVAVLAGLKIGESQLLHWAVGNGYTGISKVLMKCGLFVDAPNFLSETPLHVAAKNGFKDLAELLMQFRSNVNAKTYQQQTPLHLAAWSGQKQVAEVLMQHGSDLKARDDLQRTALHLAATNGHRQITQVLIQRGIDIKAQDGLQNTALHYAAQNGHRNALEVLIQQGSDINAGGIFGNTPLHLSALNGHQQSTEVLIEYGSDVNAISVFGKTPLHLASEYGYQRIVELLIQHGSVVTARDSSLETALHLAAKNGHKNVVELLIQRGSDVNAGSMYELTPLHLAVRYGHKQIVEIIMQHGGDVNAQDDSQQTVLHLASAHGHKSIAEFLIQHGCHVSARNNFGQTPLHLAVQNGHQQIAEFLIQHGSDVKARDYSQQSPLHLAAENGHKNTVEVLIQHESDVNSGNGLQQSALNLSAENGHKNTVEVLLQHESDVNAQDDLHQTALHLAAENGHQDIFELLVQHGGDVNAKNKRGQSALHLATRNGHKHKHKHKHIGEAVRNISITPADIMTIKTIAVVVITIACILLGVCVFVWKKISRDKVCFQAGLKLPTASSTDFKWQSVHDVGKIHQVSKGPLKGPILHLEVPTVHLEEPTIHRELTLHRKVLKTHHKVTTNNTGERGDLCTEDFTSYKTIQEEYNTDTAEVTRSGVKGKIFNL